jgi:adenine specific DNA methylase Mod
MDEIFGSDRFRNEIIWHYRTGNISEKQFQRKHDNILFYSKGDEIKFNVQEDDLVKSQDEFYDKIIASLRIFVTPLASNYFDFIHLIYS